MGVAVSPTFRLSALARPALRVLPFALFLVGYALVPRYAQERQLTTLIFIGISALLALGLNLLMGHAGQISLGHAAFFGMGAYTSGILTIQPIGQEVIPGLTTGLGVMVGCVLLISLTRFAGWRLALGVAVLIGLSWVARLFHLPQFGVYLLYAVVMAALVAVLKAGWWKGLISGLGTVVTTTACGSSLTRVLQNGGTSPWNAMIVGIVLTCVVAYLIGGQVLRLKGHYLAMGTLAFGIIVEIVFRQWTEVTGGSADGIFGVPGIEFMNSLPRWMSRLYTLAAGHVPNAKQEYFYLVWAFVFIALVIASNIVRSRVGRAMMAVHSSEVAAESLGVDTERYKVQIFVLSAGLASLAGSLYAHNAGVGYIGPSEFGLNTSIQIVVMVVVGGLASVWGSLVGAAAIELLAKQWLPALESSAGLTGLEPIVFGAVLIIVMIVLPRGVLRGFADATGAVWRMFVKRKPVDAERSS